jgi:hypothetical protein
MYTVTPRQIRVQRRVYLPQERVQVNGVGLGDLEGFNIGKMFKRMVTFTPSSFKLKNMLGALGSVTATVATGGLAPIISSKTFGAHSSAMKTLGTVTAIAGGAIAGGVGLAAVAPGLLPAIGAGLSSVGSGAMSLLSSTGGLLTSVGGGLLKSVGGIFGGGGGGSQQQQGYETGYTQAQQQIAQQQQQQQYDEYMRQQAMEQFRQQQIAQSYSLPNSGLSNTLFPSMPGGGGSSGGSGAYPVAGPDMQLPQAMALSPEQEGMMVDSRTGQLVPRVVQAGMIPDLSGTTWLIIGGVTLAGWYFFSEKKGVGNA